MQRTEIVQLIDRLRNRQAEVSKALIAGPRYEDLEKPTPDGSTVRETIEMWIHEFRSHHRELILARGRMTNDNPLHHVPNYVRMANEEFGKFLGELSALSDEDLDRPMPDGGRSIREIAEHVIASLEGYFVQQIDTALQMKKEI